MTRAKSAETDTKHESGLYVNVEDNAISWTVQASKPVGYEIRFEDGIFEHGRFDSHVLGGAATSSPRRFVVVEKNVDLLHGDKIRKHFDFHDIECDMMVVTANETVKEFETAAQIISAIDRFGIDRRREPIIVIGGGVLMDVVGLVGSLYRRGTPFVRVPTTLIGLVDAGVGVKTGVNFNGHKNRLGTYFSADLTVLDRTFLATLDRRHVSNGFGEILKMALIKDRQLFELLEEYGQCLLDEKFQGRSTETDEVAVEVLRRAIHGMLEELQPNLWEAKLERSVDYGHTFSPTIEMRALPELLHGEAVCVDMALTTILARRRGLLTGEEENRIFSVMRALELPSYDPLVGPGVLTKALEDTVRHRDGLQRIPLPVGIGDVTFCNDLTVEEIDRATERQREIGHARGAQ
jgi:3-dehydroquinate synthetase